MIVLVKRGSEEDMDEKELCLFNGRQDLPLFCRKDHGLAVLEIFKAILQQQSENIVCHSRPTGVQKNAVFLIDLNDVDFKDLTADDNGVWEIASPRRKYALTFKGTKVQSAVLSNDARAYTLVRQYGVHKATKAKQGVIYQRIISRVYSPENEL